MGKTIGVEEDGHLSKITAPGHIQEHSQEVWWEVKSGEISQEVESRVGWILRFQDGLLAISGCLGHRCEAEYICFKEARLEHPCDLGQAPSSLVVFSIVKMDKEQALHVAESAGGLHKL